MFDSAIAQGGWPAFFSAVVIGLITAQIMATEFLGTKAVPAPMRFRWFVFWMLWCGLTPVRPWYIDIPLMMGSWLLLEFFWQRWKFRPVEREERS